MPEADVGRLFGAALMAQPPAPARFTLYFQFDSEELTEESRTLLGDVQQAVKLYPAPQVTVTGHTDTVGSAESNVELGLRRANVVRTHLIDAGLDATAIDVTSHGEATPLVATADEVSEPQNRRVEITVR
jgi:outer membrane protein OmpA-like peptidoglycan-associated protein